MSESLLDLNTLVSACNGSLISNASECFFTSVVTDSRNVLKNSLFVPLVGEFQNGHKYIPQAVEKGASVVLVNRNEATEDLSSFASVVFIAVDNTLHALQAAARAYAQKVASNMIRVSVTGSSGKTTTKEMLVSVCKEHFGADSVAYTKGNFNSETGLPLSIFQIRGDEKIGIFEMGMNRKNEIGEISDVWRSQYGIITNIGNAHIGILGSRENIALEKRKSFDYIPASGAAFVPADDDFADLCTENVKGKVVRFGKNISQAESGVKFIESLGLAGSRFSLDGLEITLPLSGDYNYQNALGVVALAKELGIPAAEIKKGLENMQAVSGRMEVKSLLLKSGLKCNIICDCYNANPDSMTRVIEFCGQVNECSQKLFVLGDMKELGEKSGQAHREVAKALSKVLAAVDAGASLVILVGPEMKAAAELLGNKALYFENNDQDFYKAAAQKVLAFARENALILIKGSHSMALEKILPLIEEEKAGEDR